MRRSWAILAATFMLAGAAVADDAKKTTETKPDDKAKKEPGDYGELKDYKHTVIIIVDRSGSMAIADRFKTALDEVDKILAALPATTGFGVYLFDTKAVSVFDSNAVKTHDPARQRLRKRVDELGGCDRAAFTDIAAALPTAIRARPDAIYLLSDGVPTKGLEEAEKIVKSIKEILPTKKFPIHTIAIRGGTYDGLEENDEIARANLKAIADATGGKHREIESKAKETTALKRPTTPSDDISLHFWNRNHEFTIRELEFPRFDIEVRDALFSRGEAVVEYASVSLEIRTRTDAGVEFDSVKDITLEYREPDAEKKSMGLGGTLDQGAKSFWTLPVKVVRPQDFREDVKDGNIFVKIPTEGGTLEVIYKRGKKECKKTFAIKVPYQDPRNYTGK